MHIGYRLLGSRSFTERATSGAWERWRRLLFRLIGQIFDDRIPLIAAGVTFFVILALFPGLGALISIYGLFADPGQLAAHLDVLENVAPGGAIAVLRDQLARLAATGRSALGFSFAVSLLISLWSANAGVKALFDALNLVFHEPERRNFIVLNLFGLLFTLGTLAFVMVALAVLVLLPLIFAYLPHLDIVAALFGLARWPVLLVLATLALALLFRYGPSRARGRGVGSAGAASRRRCCGSRLPHSSPGTSPISAATTRPTARSARFSAS